MKRNFTLKATEQVKNPVVRSSPQKGYHGKLKLIAQESWDKRLKRLRLSKLLATGEQ